MVALAVFAVWVAARPAQRPARLIKIAWPTVQKAPERDPDEELALLRDEQLSKIPALDTLLRRSARVSAIQKVLAQAGMNLRAGNFLVLCAALPALWPASPPIVWSSNPAIAWVALLVGVLASLFLSSPTGATSALKNSKNFFPRPSTLWPAPFAPDTPSPPLWK